MIDKKAYQEGQTMIEPPKNCGDCKKIFAEFGIDIMIAPMAEGGVSLFYRAGKLAEMLNEMGALRAIVKELAACDPIQVNLLHGRCIFCLGTDMHEADCLISKAKGALK